MFFHILTYGVYLLLQHRKKKERGLSSHHYSFSYNDIMTGATEALRPLVVGREQEQESLKGIYFTYSVIFIF